jgi:hypothetical protein
MIDAAEAASKLEEARPWFEEWRQPTDFALRLRSM